MFKSIGTNELIIIGILILVFFGAKKLPELGKGLGESKKEIKKTFKPKDGSSKKDNS